VDPKPQKWRQPRSVPPSGGIRPLGNRSRPRSALLLARTSSSAPRHAPRARRVLVRRRTGRRFSMQTRAATKSAKEAGCLVTSGRSSTRTHRAGLRVKPRPDARRLRGDTTNGGHPGERPCKPRRQAHTHVYLTAHRRLRVHVCRGGLITLTLTHLGYAALAGSGAPSSTSSSRASGCRTRMTNDAVSARRFKVLTQIRMMRCGSSHTLCRSSYTPPPLSSASIATAFNFKPAVALRFGLGLRGVWVNPKQRPGPVRRRTEARRARGTRLGALLLVLARRSALLGLLRLPSELIPPDGGTLRSRCWRHFSGFGSTLVHFFLFLDPH